MLIISQGKMVDGDHMVLFRSIQAVKPKQELLLDYGEKYWEHHGSNHDESDKESVEEALKKHRGDSEGVDESE